MIFRKRIKLLPGLHVNLSKNGVSYSVGPKGFKHNISKRGVTRTASANILGVSISDRQKVADWKPVEEIEAEEISVDTIREAINYAKVKRDLYGLIGLCLILAGVVVYLPIGLIGLCFALRAGYYSKKIVQFIQYEKAYHNPVVNS